MTVETLLAKVEKLQAENAKLRRIAKRTGAAARLDRIHTDAKQLLVWRFSGFAISQRACQEYGMTRRSWQWARGLLMLAGVHDGRDLTCTDFNQALESLEAATRRVQTEGLDRLKFILPTHCTLENWYKRQEKKARNTARNTAHQTVSQDASFSDTSSTDRGGINASIGGGGQRDRRREIEQRQGMQ
jgi:hypothetical protein